MDIQTGLVCLGLVILSGVVLFVISIFGMREKTYEEAIAEQRKMPDEALLLGRPKDKNKDKNKKRQGKKVKEKPNKEKAKDKEPMKIQPPTETDNELQQKELEQHVNFVEPEAKVITDNTPPPQHEEKKKKKKEKVKPILVNKEDPIVVNEEVPDPEVPANHFEDIVPKDDLQLKLSSSKSDLRDVGIENINPNENIQKEKQLKPVNKDKSEKNNNDKNLLNNKDQKNKKKKDQKNKKNKRNELSSIPHVLNRNGDAEKHGTYTSQPGVELLDSRMRNSKIITQNLFEFVSEEGNKVDCKDVNQITQQNDAHENYSDFREIMRDQGRPTATYNTPVLSVSAATTPMLQPPERPWIPSLFPDFVIDANFRGFEGIILGFCWDFTELNALEEVTPLMPKYESFEERFDTYKMWRNFNFRRVFLLTSFGLYFSHDPTDSGNGLMICFFCGAQNSLKVYEDRKDDYNCIHHHRHCSFIKILCQNEWVKNFKRKIRREPSKEFTEAFRKFQEERAAEMRHLIPRIRSRLSNKLLKFIHSLYFGVSKGFCLDCNRRTQVQFHPCRDFVSCTDCAKKRDFCSYCNKPFTGIIRIITRT